MAAKSYTQWSTFKKCGLQYKFRYIEKLAVLQSTSAARGTSNHAHVENLIKGEIDVLPDVEGGPPLKNYEDFFLMLREKGAVPEVGFSLDRSWQPTEDWDNVWVRGYIDLVVPLKDSDTLYLYELKTGREYDDHLEQRHFYGTASLPMYPEYKKVKVIGVYMDGGFNRENTYTRDMFRTYVYLWNERLAQMDVPEAMVPRPGPYCRWCPFSKDKGGPCAFSGN